MSNPASPNCPQCGAPLPPGAPGGLCPRCLMALNLKTETVFTDDTPAAQPPLPSEQIAPHFPQLEILECLGRGGMGVVYKARQKTLNRFVALKLLAPERVSDAKFAGRFAREAQALAALNHPNIVTIHDFGQAGGFYFLLMEFVDGVNLRQLLRTRKFTPEEALAIVPPLCDALQFAHERGIVHRDIKPENLLLDKTGRVKVADFGIAKMLGNGNGSGLAGESTATDNATQNALGTPGYSAPEQKTDPQRVDSRADIYSLGVVFYEMLTGELPGQRIEPPSRKVHIDVRLDQVVLRALEKTPELRFQQASEVKTCVENIAATPASGDRLREALPTKNPNAGPGQSPVSPAPSRFQSLALLALDILGALLLVLLGWGASQLGIFFNALFFFIFVMAVTRLALFIVQLVQRKLACRIWQKPLAAEHRKYWWQLLNRWIFWLLAGWILELCMMPIQFPPSQYFVMHALYWGGITVLLLLALLPARRIYLATNLAFALGSLFMATQVIKIYRPAPRSEGVVLAAPFHGEWVVFNGGGSKVLNQNYGLPREHFALDVERVVHGQERSGDENLLESYPSWGAILYAPASGKVVKVVNDVVDNGIGQGDPENPAGNYVVMDIGGGRFLEMDQLKQGSVLVHPGDTVLVGQPFAQCGNSGAGWHPLLHLRVQSQVDISAAGAKTYPIFFKEVTCVRAGHPRPDAPFFVRRNDLIFGEAPLLGTNSTRRAQAWNYRTPDWQPSAGAWTNWNNHQDIGSFYTIAASSNVTVAMGIDGHVATRNAATGIWQMENFTGDPDFRGVIYANGQFIALREAGGIMTSPDGLAWTPRVSPVTNNLLGGLWDGHQYLIGGDRGTLLASPDGITWTRRNTGSDISLSGFSYSGSRYVAMGNDGILISDDAVTWHPPSNWTETARVPFIACTWTGSEFLACGLGLDKLPTIYTSPDGETWTLRDQTITASLRAAITVNGTIYVAGDSMVARSTDGGTTWTNIFPLVPGNRLFMGLASDGQCLIAAGFNQNVWALPLVNTFAAAETWSPTLAPGEKPDLSTIRNDIKIQMDQTNYSGALQRQIWYFNHALENGESDAVRLSFGLMYWDELGRKDPAARQALVELRDRDLQQFSAALDRAPAFDARVLPGTTPGSQRSLFDLYQEISALNRALNDNDAYNTMVKLMVTKDPAMAAHLGYKIADDAFDILLKKNTNAARRGDIGDGQAAFGVICQQWLRLKKEPVRLARIYAPVRPDTTHSPAPNGIQPLAPIPPVRPIQDADRAFVGKTRQIIDLLVAHGHRADAEYIRDQAQALVDDPWLKVAVSDAVADLQSHPAAPMASTTK